METDMQTKNGRTLPAAGYLALAVYFIVFYLLWALFEFKGTGIVDGLMKDRVAAQIFKTVVVKNLLWTVPAMLLVSRCGDRALVGLKEMFTRKVNWKQYLPVFGLFTVCLAVNRFFAVGGLRLNRGFGVCTLIGLLFVGLTEEMVFRGLLLNVTADKDKPLPALLINSAMFMAIHFPVWIIEGQFVGNFTSGAFLTLIVLSIIFGKSFLSSRSILVPIALHMYWDALMFILA